MEIIDCTMRHQKSRSQNSLNILDQDQSHPTNPPARIKQDNEDSTTTEVKRGIAVRKSINTFVRRTSLRKSKIKLRQDYKMSRPNRGVHLIFAQQTFDQSTRMGTREGTVADVKALKKAFRHLGFENYVYRDRTKAGLKDILEKWSKFDHSDCDCIAVTILTHGSMTELYARDASFPAEEIWQPFEADKCTSLTGRPKLFISQACKGNRKNPGVELDFDGPNVIPTQNDFIWGFSTMPGDVSWRDPQTGSIYIQTLCKVILEDKKRERDFDDILLTVNWETKLILNKKWPGYMQCPNFASTLTGKVWFPMHKRDTQASESAITAVNEIERIQQAMADCSIGSNPQENKSRNT